MMLIVMLNLILYHFKKGEKVLTQKKHKKWLISWAMIFLLFLSACNGDGDESSSTDAGDDNNLPPITNVSPGFTISKVTGNTASYNSVAEFDVRLVSQPSSEVFIPISSSDENEGVVVSDNLTFTPDDWNQAHTVIVKGRNMNVQDGVQNYKIILSPAQSADSNYNGLDPNDVDMKGIVLELSPPQNMSSFVSSISSEWHPITIYTGNSSLSYSLEEKPNGMQIDFNSGVISWTPSESYEGNSFNVKVKVTDGARFAETSFTVSVASNTVLQSEVQRNTLTITEEGSNLKGLSIEAVDNSSLLSKIQFEKLPENEAPSIPRWINRISDFFVVKATVSGDIKIKLPLSQLPIGTNLNRVNLYSYIKADDIPEAFWSSVLLDVEFEGDDSNPIMIISLAGIGGMYFIGIEQPEEIDIQTQAFSQNRELKQYGERDNITYATSISTSDVTCKPRKWFFDIFDNYGMQDCTVANKPDVKIFVRNFGSTKTATRWHGTTIEELITWLMDAQDGFVRLDLDYENNFIVQIEKMNYLGYVTTGNNEDRGVLHITSSNEKQSTIQGTSVHEYFHHAQSRSKMTGKDLLIDGGTEKDWLIEGTARWFEDYLYDSLDTYKSKEGIGNRILEVGLNAKAGKGSLRAYQRFAFFKLLSQKCTGFEGVYKKLINIDRSTDASGIKNLRAQLANATCNFGDHLGSSNTSSLESALVFYQYATLFENKISLLDSNEADSKFKFKKTPYDFNRPWLDNVAEWLSLDDNVEYKLNNVNAIPSSGAYSFYTKGIQGELPDGKVAVLNISSDADLIVSLISKDSNFKGENKLNGHEHIWFRTKEKSNFIYDFNGTIPEVFVTLVNPSTDKTAKVKVTFDITDELNYDLALSSPTEGSNVNNRVISVTGSVPVEANDVDRVIVTNGNIKTIAVVHSDNQFSAEVVVAMGDNILKLQGYNSQDMTKALTKEKILNVVGVEKTSSGRNALIPSRIAYVLRWNTNNTDVDIYSTDKNNQTIWFDNKSVLPGFLDFDHENGYGPEVVSYRKTDDSVYVNGSFKVDIHFFKGSGSTKYSLDVVLNETDAANRRTYHFDSAMSLSQSNSDQKGPDGTGSSRFNDILTIECNDQRICTLSAFEQSKLTNTSNSSFSISAFSLSHVRSFSGESIKVPNEITVYEHCLAEFDKAVNKVGYVEWQCDPQTGGKIWP
jgi:uncharacterized protein YfaP (DUF2135 family)